MNSNHTGYRNAVLTAKRTKHIADNISPVVSNHSFPLESTLPHIKQALILLHKSHKDILVTLSPTQKLVLASYHRLIISMYDYLKSKSDGSELDSTIGNRTASNTGTNCCPDSSAKRIWRPILSQTKNCNLWSLQRVDFSNEISQHWLQRLRSCNQQVVWTKYLEHPQLV